MAHFAKMTPKKRAEFIAVLRDTANVSRACDAVNISRTTAYDWREADEDFAEDWKVAIEAATDDLEEEARRRAYHGLRRKKFTKGGDPIIDPETGDHYSELEYSDTLLIFLLKAHRSDKYRDHVEHSGEIKTQAPVLNIVLSNGTTSDSDTN